MNDTGRFQRSWLLVKSSLSVIARNKMLLVFPIVTLSLTAILVLFFVAPVTLRPTGHSVLSAEHWEAIGHSLFKHSSGGHDGQLVFTPAAAVYFAFLYLASMFFATFFNVAFFHEILAALSGQPVSIGRGLKFASTRLKAILMWSLFAGVVGLIIKAIEERLGVVGRIVGKLIGVAWSVAAVFVIPIIVQEEQGANPFKMLRRSASILKNTWGEALLGYAGLGFANLVVTFGGLIMLLGILALSITVHNFWFFGFGCIGYVVLVFGWSYFSSVASQVYKAALYLYAAQGTVPEPYSREMLDSAWKFKKS